jgi:hypothetical protein
MSVSMHDFIVGERAQILAYCAAKVRPFSPESTMDMVVRELGSFLGELVAALAADRGEPYTIGDGGTATSTAFGKYVQNQKLSVTTIARQFGMICDGVCQTAIHSGVELHGRDYQTMNAVVDAAIAAAIEGFIGDDRKEFNSSHTHQMDALLHEVSNAQWAARTAFDILREGTVGVKSMTTAVLDRALRRIEALAAPRRPDADKPVVA